MVYDEQLNSFFILIQHEVDKLTLNQLLRFIKRPPYNKNFNAQIRINDFEYEYDRGVTLYKSYQRSHNKITKPAEIINNKHKKLLRFLKLH